MKKEKPLKTASENRRTVQAKRVHYKSGVYKGHFRTEFYKNGTLFATLPVQAKQIRKDAKTVILNCFKYNIEWI